MNISNIYGEFCGIMGDLIMGNFLIHPDIPQNFPKFPFLLANIRPGGNYNGKVLIALYCKYLKARWMRLSSVNARV